MRFTLQLFNEQLSFLNRHDINWLNNVDLISRGFKTSFGGLIIRVIHRKTSGHFKQSKRILMSINKSRKIIKFQELIDKTEGYISVTLTCPHSTQSNKKPSELRSFEFQLTHRRLNQSLIFLSFLWLSPIILEYSKWKKLDN